MAADQGGPRAGTPGAGDRDKDRAGAGDTGQQNERAGAGAGPAGAGAGAGPAGAGAGPAGAGAGAAGAGADPRRIATPHDFGRELTLARQRAGRTVREVARAAGIPASTAGDYFAGRHLPPASQPELLTRILHACGEASPPRMAAWADALAAIRRGPGRRSAVPPYRGLASFQPDDRKWFFGREELTGRLAALVADTGSPGGAGLPLAVVGPSGSGKSSLLRAGVIPALAGRPAHRLVLFTPGGTPLAGLARALAQLGTGPGQPAGAGAIEAALRADPADAGGLLRRPPGPDSPAGGSTGGPPVIVADQFEEAFTECPDEADRQRFITAVCALAGPAVVAIALRADFYDHALRYPGLTRALQDRQVVVGPMTREEVRRAIVQPARLARVQVDDGLVELLLRDLAPAGRGVPAAGPAPAHEPGALPLLSHALLTTWNNSHGGRLTVADYQAAGGIQDAIARTANEVYASLDEPGRDIARRLFLRLVHVADDAPEARAAVRLSDLPGRPDRPDRPDAAAASPRDVLDRFITARLITVDAGSARISHEAVLTAWPLLRDWIDDNRDGLRVRRRISEAAQAWHEAGRDHAALLRGGQLALARDWSADPVNTGSLSPLARRFIDASVAGEKLHEAAERNRTRRLHRLVAGLTVLVLLTITLAGYAFQQRHAASVARARATQAAASAQSREVAVEADQIRGQDPALAAQLSLAAYRIARTADARASLLESSGTPDAAALTDSSGPVQAVALRPGHRVLAVAAADGTLRLWDVARPGHPVPLGGPLLPENRDAPLYTAAFNADGTVLAAAGAGRKVWLWDVRNPARAVRLPDPLTGPASTVYSVAFSPRGAVLAAGSNDDTVRLWDLADPAHPVPLGAPLGRALGDPADAVESVAFSPDGATLAAGSANGTVQLWDVAGPAHAAALGKPLSGPGDVVTSVAFSPDGRTLAAGSQDEKVWLWHVAAPRRPVPAGTLAGATSWVNAVSFSPDGQSLAVGSSDSQVRVWNLASRTLSATLPHPQPVTSLAWDGPGRLVSGDADGEARTWTLPTPVLRAGSPVNDVAFAPHGGLLAVAGTGLQVWAAARRTELSAAAAPASARIVNVVAFAPGGTVLAAGYGNGTMQLWRVSAAGRLAPLSLPVRAERYSDDVVEFAAFSPDGRLLATCGDDGAIRLWSVTDPARPRLLSVTRDSGDYVFTVAFRRDGKLLAAASSDGLTRLWDVADPARPAPVGRALGGLLSYAYSVAFSPDGRTLAVGGADKSVHLWDVADPARARPLGRPLTGPGGYVYSVAFSPDGRTLGIGVTDGSVWLWRVASPARAGLLATLTGPAGNVYSVSFSPDGRVIAAGSADGTVRLWDTTAAAAASAVCGTAGQPLTRAQWAAYLPGRRYAAPCPGR